MLSHGLSRSFLTPLATIALFACTPARPRLPERPPPPMTESPATAARAAPAPAPSLPLYLPSDRTGGSPYCLDPDSARLRAIIKSPKPEETDVVDTAALAEDVRDLHSAMKRLYSGYPELLEDPHYDVDAFFADWEHDVRAAGGTITLADGLLKRFLELRKAHRDNHLAFRIAGTRFDLRPELAIADYHHEGRVDADPATCAFAPSKPIADTWRSAKLLTKRGMIDLTTFSAQSSAPAIDVRCGGDTLHFARHVSSARANEDAPPAYEWHTHGDAAIIVIRRLSGSPEDRDVLRALAKDYDSHRKSRVIVFDFRGNGGGDDGYVHEWIDRAVAGRWPATHAALNDIAGQTPCGDWNAMVVDQVAHDRIDTLDAKLERERYAQKTFHATAAPVQSLWRGPEESHARSPFAGRVFVLVDHESGSSGESAPEQLHAALGATMVGERTAGYAEYGNVRPWFMPRTGTRWALPSTRNYFESPREGVGIPVAVYLDPEFLALPADALVPILESLPKSAP